MATIAPKKKNTNYYAIKNMRTGEYVSSFYPVKHCVKFGPLNKAIEWASQKKAAEVAARIGELLGPSELGIIQTV